LHKSLDWKYEKERRLIMPGTDKDSAPANRPRAIYTGFKVSKSIEEDLKEFAFDKNIKPYRMSHDKSEFKMMMVRVSQ
jgi:hypothetical protein